MLEACTPKLDLSPQVRLMIRLASGCLVVYWLAIFLATHMPSAAMPKLTYSDKVYHAGAFAGLSFLLCWALPTREGFSARWRQVSIAGIISVSYGCIDELTQQFIPGRCCDVWDMTADAVGVMIGISCYLACRQLLVQFEFGRNVISKFSR
ncbi:MAG: VanZ family protein [Aureliella sp.]